ncbi:MAG: hypothetical protein M5R40_11760 [Anaerolineae bacterium]|nr:hypothetical protein [Anaerolineae bacterium]
MEERVRLAKRILETVEGDLPAETGKEPRLSLYGALADLNLNVSEEDIAEVRREMLANFPREDIA